MIPVQLNFDELEEEDLELQALKEEYLKILESAQETKRMNDFFDDEEF